MSKPTENKRSAGDRLGADCDSCQPVDLDALMSRMDSIFSTKSASSLSMMTGENFVFRLNGVATIGPEYLDKVSERFSQDVCAVYLKAEGEVRAAMLLYLENQNARQLAAKLIGQQVMEELDAMGKSAISEVCNILFAGCFLNSVCAITGLKTFSSVPGIGIGELRAMVDLPVADMAETSPDMVATEAELVAEKSGIILKMLLVIGKEDANKLSKASASPGVAASSETISDHLQDK